MAEDSNLRKLASNSTDANNESILHIRTKGRKRLVFLSTEKDISTQEESNITDKHRVTSDDSDSRRRTAEIIEQLQQQAVNKHESDKSSSKSKDDSPGNRLNSKQNGVDIGEDKENSAADNLQEEEPSVQSSLQDRDASAGRQRCHGEDGDAEVVRRAQEEGHVNVVLPGMVTQDGCCRFVSEILKCVLYQRQQLPMTYDQLVYSQKRRQASLQEKETASRTPSQSADLALRKCQRTLQELEEVLQHLEVLFSLSRVPRVLLLMGGSLILPKELYEVNMEALEVAGGDQCLRVSSCLRQLFRTLFVADLLSDSRPVRLMPTTVLALAHRDCGVGWFRPKLQFKEPTRVKKHVIALSTDPSSCKELRVDESNWQDYVWFQAATAVKGFSK